MTTNLVSLFSGVGGFDLGLERAGMKTVFQCEIDRHATTILQRHWPDVARWDDVRTLTGRRIVETTEQVDVIAWGSPCQDLSVAGRREGLKGERSGLFREGIRIIKEIREVTNGKYPRISIWENVHGALTSHRGEHFRAVLNQMAECGSRFSEWRVLDSQYFGIPQRRRRVFLVSVFDASITDEPERAILSFTESVSRNTAKNRSQGSNDSRTTVDTSSASNGTRPILIDRAAYNQGINAQYKPYIKDEPVIPSIVAKGPHAVEYEGVIRQITPIESERLMGWPDGWTEGVSDTQRYRQCGNGVVAPVAQWVGEQVMKLFNEGEPNV